MAAAPVTPIPPPPTPEKLSEGARIVNTFVAPSKTFTDLRRSAAWWGPWLLISIVSLVFIYVMGNKVGFEQISKNQISHSKRADAFDKLPADQQATQLRISAKIIAGFGYGSPFLILFFSLISTTALWATFKVGAAAETTFGQAYAIVMYAGLPGIVGAILGIVSFFAGVNPEGFDINNPVATNPAYFMNPSEGKFLYGMASALDVIIIWVIILMGIGFAANSKVKRSTAIMIVAAWYLLYKLVGAAFGAAFS